MKKEFFFFNLKALNPIFFKKTALVILPIKYLIRHSDVKNSTLALIDTFSFFFTLKLFKRKNNNKKVFLNKQFFIKKKSKILGNKSLTTKKVGNYLLLENFFYLSQNNFKFSFIFYKQFSFLKKIKYLSSFISQLKLINKFKNNITFFKKKKIKRGLMKYYFNGILILKHIKKKKFKKKNTKIKTFFLKQPLIMTSDKNYLFNKTQAYLLSVKKMCILSHFYSTTKVFNKKLFGLKVFASRKKLYKKDFRHAIHLNLKKKRKYFKKKKIFKKK